MSNTDLYRQIDAIKRWRKRNPHKVREYKLRNKVKKLERRDELIENNPEQLLLERARTNAHVKHQPCDLTIEDISLPESCPLLGCLLFFDPKNPAGPNTPSIDRIDNTKGYIKGNVWIISRKANTMKSNASVEELITFSKNVLETFR